MEFNDVDVQQYGGIVNFHQNCGGGSSTSGNINTPPKTPTSNTSATPTSLATTTLATPTLANPTLATPTLATPGPESPSIPVTDARTLVSDIDKTEIDSTIPYSIIVVGLFVFFFIFIIFFVC